MLDENKGYLMTIFSAIVAVFLFHKINIPFNTETAKCIFSVILGIIFCSLYMIEGICIIAKLLTGFMVSYTVGLPLFWNFSKWIIPQFPCLTEATHAAQSNLGFLVYNLSFS